MNLLSIQFALAGLCFGLWPLFMNKSGLSGNLSSFIICVITVLFIFPFAFSEFKNIVNVNWLMIIIAGVFASIGLIFFNKGLFKASPQEVSSLFMTMVVVQITIPILYKIILNSGIITMKQTLGFGTAILTAILLN